MGTTFEYRDAQSAEAIDGVRTLDEAAAIVEEALRYDAHRQAVSTTVWLTADVVEVDAEGGDIDGRRIEITVHPPEPACPAGHHHWQSPYLIVGGLPSNPGVWGHGNGILVEEVCMGCGVARVTDTWATNRATGAVGLVSVRYDEERHRARVEQISGRAIAAGLDVAACH